MNVDTQIDIQQLVQAFLSFYSTHKFNPELSQVTDFLLTQALCARGYNNFRNSEESGEAFFIKSVLAPTSPKLCLDIGANVGNYTCELLRATNSKVISFEPLPGAFRSMQEQVREFSDRVILENKGVGAANEDLVIHFSPNALSQASFSEEVKNVSYVSNEEQALVPVVTLDSYCQEHQISEIDFIKIDTEGYEAEVFKGAERVLHEIKPKFIQIEFNWHQLFRNTSLHYFSELLPEYQVFQLLPNGWINRDPRSPLSNIFEFSNFVFVRR
jgi:FkbM family methyltransferase